MGCYPPSVLVFLVWHAAAACGCGGVGPSRYSCDTPLCPLGEFPERLQAGFQVAAQLPGIEPVILRGERVPTRWGKDPTGEQPAAGVWARSYRLRTRAPWRSLETSLRMG